MEKGHKPITEKEVQTTPWYANLPRFLDMCASYLEFVKRVGDEFFVVMDEAPQRFGEGSGSTRARSRQGTMVPLAQPHYLSNCTHCFVLGMHPPRVIKATVRAGACAANSTLCVHNSAAGTRTSRPTFSHYR